MTLTAQPDDSEASARRIVGHAVDALLRQELVIFLGAGANLAGRPDGAEWNQADGDLPSGPQLSNHLWTQFLRSGKIDVAPSDGLTTVAQAVVLELGMGPLYAELRRLLEVRSPILPLYELLASLPARVARMDGVPSKAASFRPLLYVSTNYDDVLERAFESVGQPFHTYTYDAENPSGGRFVHRYPDGTEQRLNGESLRDDVPDDPVLLKFHGGLNRADRGRDSFVITEDHYLEYLAEVVSSSPIPTAVQALMGERHILFLGHALRDWNLRVLLRQLWKEQRDWSSWAVQKHAKPLERKFWDSKHVEILNYPLDAYGTLFDERLREVEAGR